MKCDNGCPDKAEVNFTWPTSQGTQRANLCGCCASMWWSRYKNTEAGQGLIIADSEKESA